MSKAHFNGMFIEEIDLGRGVRQGCPLVPLLFALSTQPFMSLLKLWVDEGKLKGIPLDAQVRINSSFNYLLMTSVALFLLESEENFQAAHEVVAINERI